MRLAIGEGVRLVPGGESTLRLRRRAFAAARRRFDPVRPPLHSPAHISSLSRTAEDHPFITGNRIAAHCRYVINFDELVVNEHVDNDWWFVQSDFLEHFFRRLEPSGRYVLFSHNSDRPVDRSLHRFFDHAGLSAWFATNLVARHPKLRALPIGIADVKWPHGDGAALLRVQSQSSSKTNLFDASYDVSTYPPAREYCRVQTGIDPSPRREFEHYLRNLASSYFCIAPRGHGIDTHRVWEALYLRTVPVVTRSVLTDEHPELPMVVLDDWSQFRSMEFSAELYERVMREWSPDALGLNRYLERIRRILES